LLAAGDALGHYDRALAIADRLGHSDLGADLHARRGSAYRTITRWPEARRELEAALGGLAAEQAERRAELLVELLEVCWWLLDVRGLRTYATEAIELSSRLGRADLETLATCWLAAPIGADGDLDACRELFDRAAARGRALGAAPPVAVYTYRSLPPYWLGRLDEAVAYGAEGVSSRARRTTPRRRCSRCRTSAWLWPRAAATARRSTRSSKPAVSAASTASARCWPGRSRCRPASASTVAAILDALPDRPARDRLLASEPARVVGSGRARRFRRAAGRPRRRAVPTARRPRGLPGPAPRRRR
jgi:hypothetical protein